MAAGKESFSEYHMRPIDFMTIAPENPLGFLQGDQERGWQVARNLHKPLNHLVFLKRKEKIAVKLNLHNVITPPEVFDLNYCMLEEHQQGEISTSKLLNHLSFQLRESGDYISDDEIRKILQEYSTVRYMEFHPSDVCNLTCLG